MLDKSKLTILNNNESILSKYDVVKLQNWGVEDMRIHLYTSWEGIENYKLGKPFFAWRKDNKSDSDLHIDVNIDHYHIEEENELFCFTKKTQAELLNDTFKGIKFK